jgi:hypothetical protein
MTADSELINVYDSEMEVLLRIKRELDERTYKSHDLNAFDREIIERYAEAGFVVKVTWYDTDQKGTYCPEIEVIGRCDPIRAGEFDHDRMRHEVVNNYLGLPESDAGIIKSDGFVHPEKHAH